MRSDDLVRSVIAELMTSAEIARALGWKNLDTASKVPSFPDPIGTIGRSKVWRRHDVETWAATTQRRPAARLQTDTST